jgi:DNA-binding NtrC family response regulator
VLVVGQGSELLRATGGLRREAQTEISLAANTVAALRLIRRNLPDLVLLDLTTCNGDAWSLLKALGSQRQAPSTVVLGAGTDVKEAVEAMKLGAADYVVNTAESADALRRTIDVLVAEAAARRRAAAMSPGTVAGIDEIACESDAMKNVMATVQRIAPFDASVLILGESGSGKEIIARALHQLSPRREREFVPVNCATLSGEILENELFGHERGAFTSADERKIGVFEVADGGTLLLDEINEMSLSVQAKLLRVLERREFRRVGGTKKIKVDLRILAATNVDLDAEVEARRFREDLYYRLKVITISVPPLRERREDTAVLARHFLRQMRDRGAKALGFSEQAMTCLASYSWPGNVRELRNVIESAALMSNGGIIDVRDLPLNIRSVTPPPDFTIQLGMTMAYIEREVIGRYLESYPTKKAAAQALGIGLRTLHAKVKRYRLSIRRSSTRTS